ncbi:hypothetical protein TorRG33x02_119520, partial [Trema orientale]
RSQVLHIYNKERGRGEKRNNLLVGYYIGLGGKQRKAKSVMADQAEKHFLSFSSTLIINPCISVRNDQNVLSKKDQIRSTSTYEKKTISFPFLIRSRSLLSNKMMMMAMNEE